MKMKEYFRLLRVHQYLKNLFIFLPLFFSLRIVEADLLVNASLAFAIDSTADEVLRCYRRLLAAPTESPRTLEPGTSLPSRAVRGRLARGGDSAFRKRLR